MKKLSVFILLVLLAFSCTAQEQILYRDNFTIQYDAPAEMPELLTGESVVYRVWLWDMAQGTPPVADTTGWAFYAETTQLEQYVVTPTDPRKEYAVGIQLVHIRADGVESTSDFAVTTNVDDVDPAGVPGVPFVYAPDSLPSALPKVENLRDSGT
jgi:hypothetical protein